MQLLSRQAFIKIQLLKQNLAKSQALLEQARSTQHLIAGDLGAWRAEAVLDAAHAEPDRTKVVGHRRCG